MFEDIEVAFIADVYAGESELRRLPAFAEALNDVCCNKFVLFICHGLGIPFFWRSCFLC